MSWPLDMAFKFQLVAQLWVIFHDEGNESPPMSQKMNHVFSSGGHNTDCCNDSVNIISGWLHDLSF